MYPKLRCVLFLNSCTSLHFFHDFRLISDRHHNQRAAVRSQRDHRFWHSYMITAVFLERCRGQRSPQTLGFGLKIVVSAANNSSVVTFSVMASKDNQWSAAAPNVSGWVVLACQSTCPTDLIKVGSMYWYCPQKRSTQINGVVLCFPVLYKDAWESV